MRLYLLASLLLASTFLFSQNTNIQQPTSVNTDGAAPDASAILDVQSTDHGMLIPRMTTAQRTAIASPATGLLVYDTETNHFWFYDGSWVGLVGGGSGATTAINDADGDTEVQTELTTDEDIIRMNAGGNERFQITSDSSAFSGLLRVEGNFVSGTSTNLASGTNSFVGGGQDNTASGINSFVGSGNSNKASGGESYVGGGFQNTASGFSSYILGGQFNMASGNRSFIGGGQELRAKSYGETVFGLFSTDYTPLSPDVFFPKDRLFVIGNGSDSSGPSNAMTILKNGNVGIGTDIPDDSAILDMASNTKGLLIPRMGMAERMAIPDPAIGLMVYDFNFESFFYHDVNKWNLLGLPRNGNHFDVLQVDEEGNPGWTSLVSPAEPDPENVGFITLSGSSIALAVQDDYAYVLGNDGSLNIFDVSAPAAPMFKGDFSNTFTPIDVAVQGDFAYVLGNAPTNKLNIIDVSDPAIPMLAGDFNTGGSAPTSIAVEDGYAYLINQGSDSLYIVEVVNPAVPSLSGQIALGTAPMDVVVQNGFAYVVDSGTDSLYIIDISNPFSPSLSSRLLIGSEPVAVAVQGDYAYVIDSGSDDLRVIDVSIPSSPGVIQNFIVADPLSIAVLGRFVYVTDASGDLKIIDVSIPSAPTLSTNTPVNDDAIALEVQGNFAYVLDESAPAFSGGQSSNALAANALNIIKLAPATVVGMNVGGDLSAITLCCEPTNNFNSSSINDRNAIQALKKENRAWQAEIENLQNQLAEMDELKSRMAKIEAMLLSKLSEEAGEED